MVFGETKKDFLLRSLLSVGATGFEPAAAWSQTRSATGLRYTPNVQVGNKPILRVQS